MGGTEGAFQIEGLRARSCLRVLGVRCRERGHRAASGGASCPNTARQRPRADITSVLVPDLPGVTMAQR